MSAVQFQTGLRMPVQQVAEVAHRHGAELFVDAIQQLGVVPFDAQRLGVDYVAGGSHKWLMGPEGVGYLYARPSCASALVRRYASWLSHEDPADFLFRGAGHLRYDRPIRDSLDFLEIGSTNVAGCAALEVSIDALLELGVDRVFDHVSRHLDRLEQALLAAGSRAVDRRRRASAPGFSRCVRPMET